MKAFTNKAFFWNAFKFKTLVLNGLKNKALALIALIKKALVLNALKNEALKGVNSAFLKIIFYCLEIPINFFSSFFICAFHFPQLFYCL